MDKNHPIKLYMINKSKKYKVEVIKNLRIIIFMVVLNLKVFCINFFKL